MILFLSNALQRFTYFFLAIATFSYLFLPMKSVRQLLRIPDLLYEKYSIALPVILVLASILSMIYSKYFLLRSEGSVEEQTNENNQEVPQKRLKIILFSLLAILAIGRSIAGLEQPFDNDESQVAMAAVGQAQIGPIFYISTQPLSSWLAILSTKVFGVSMWSHRLPAVLFGLIFLVLLVRFCIQYTTLLTGTLLIGHLASSSIFVWYFHSTRGYAPMVLFSFILFSICYEVFEKKRALTNAKRAWILVSLILMPFTHGFGILFALTLPIPLIIWLLLNNSPSTPNGRRQSFLLTDILLLAQPFLALTLAYMFLSLSAEGTKYVGMDSSSPVAKEGLLQAISVLMGSSHSITLKLLALTSILSLYFSLVKKNLRKDLTFCILVVFFGFVIVQRVSFQTFVSGRFLLGALPILIFWIAKSLEEHWPKNRINYIAPVLFVPLILFPIMDGQPGLFQLDHREYYRFMKQARETLKGVPSNCLEFTHTGVDPAVLEAFFAEHYYLSPNRNSSASSCAERYQVHFSWAWPKETDSLLNKSSVRIASPWMAPDNLKILAADGKGRYVAQIVVP